MSLVRRASAIAPWLRNHAGAMVFAHEAVGGAGDALALLVLRLARDAAYTMIVGGAIIAWSSGELDRVDDLNTLRGLFSSLLTPLYLMAIGLGLRLLLGPAAWVLALLVVLQRSEVPSAPDERTLPRDERVSLGWTDVARTVSALTSLRWSVYARRHAVSMLGFVGRGLWVGEIVLRVAIGIGLVVLAVLVWT